MRKNTPTDWKKTRFFYDALNRKPYEDPAEKQWKQAKKFWGKVFLVVFAILALLYYIGSLPPSEAEMKRSRFQGNNIVYNAGMINEVKQVKDYILEKLPYPKSYHCTTTDWGHVEKDMDRLLFTVTHHYYADDSLGNHKYYTEYFELDTLGNVVLSEIKAVEDAERPKWLERH